MSISYKKNTILIFLYFFFGAQQAYSEQYLLKIATSTSTENSGLIEYLRPHFEKKHPYKLQVIATGTGRALMLGENGDVDAVLVHAKKQEEKFIQSGFGVNKLSVMFNDFILVGPKHDPASIDGTKTIQIALKTIVTNALKNHTLFISRGDQSGTHHKEKQLWDNINTTPDPKWYRETGQGMGKTLALTSELSGYTLSDRGTWLAMENKLHGMRAYSWYDEILKNQYNIILVNPKLHDTNFEAAHAFSFWLTCDEGQSLIQNFTVLGKNLFHPSSPKTHCEKSLKHD